MEYIVPGLAKIAGSAFVGLLNVIRKQIGLGPVDDLEKTVDSAGAAAAIKSGKTVRDNGDGTFTIPSSNTYYDKNGEAQAVGGSGSGKFARLLANSSLNRKTAVKAANIATRVATLPLKAIPILGPQARSGLVKGAEYLAGSGSDLTRGAARATFNSGSKIITGGTKAILNPGKSVAAYNLSRALGASRTQSVLGINNWLRQSKNVPSVVENAPSRLSKWLSSFFSKFSALLTSPTISNIMKEAEKAGSKIGVTQIFSKIKDILNNSIKLLTAEKSQKLLSKLTNVTAATLGAAKGMSKFIPVVGWAMIGYDVISGAFEADKLFGIDSDDVDWKMQFISSLMKGLLGLGVGPLFDILLSACSEYSGVDIKQHIATMIYDIMSKSPGADIADSANLNKAKSNFAQEVENYNRTNKTALSAYKYKELKNTPWYSKVWNWTTGKGNEDFSKYEVGKQKKSTSNTRTVQTPVPKPGPKPSAPIKKSIGNGKGSNSAGYGITKPTGMANYTQNDPRWSSYRLGSMPDGSSSNMKIGGCGPTALSNVLSAGGSVINPLQVARFAKSRGYLTEGGSSKDLFESGASELGLRSNRISRNRLAGALKSGKPVIISGKSSSGRGYGSGNSPFTNAGHIVTASGLDKHGNTIINDPMQNKPRVYNIKNLISGMTNGWVFNKKNVGYGEDTTSTNDNSLEGLVDSFDSSSNISDSLGPLSTLLGNMGNAVSNLISSRVTGKPYENAQLGSDNSVNTAAYLKNFGSSKEYINALLPGAKELQRKYGILPSLTIAQAMQESGSTGSSDLARLYNNHFGMTAGAYWKGATKTYYDKGMNKNYTYRAYKSLAESIEDYGKNLNTPLYAKVRSAKNYKEAIKAVKAAGYAEDPKYVENLTNVVENYGLASLNVGYGGGNDKNPSFDDLSNMLNITSSNSYKKDTETIPEGYGDTNTDITRRLNVAVNTSGVENKLDILIHVMKSWAERDTKNQHNTVNLYNKTTKGSTNKPPVVVNQNNSNPPVNNLRNIHQMIASGVRK